MISYITTAIPYVNARPHLGHGLELVQTDVLARHRRLRGYQVSFLTGTDDNAAKNVSAAAAAGVEVADFVATNGDAFIRLAERLGSSHDDVIRTGTDPRHRPAVTKLWQAISADLYRRDYTGGYCAGCEQFYRVEDLVDGLCPEHRIAPHQVTEQNWFFALSRYQQRIEELITSNTVSVQPAHRRAEVLSFVRSGLADFSVSRPSSRSAGWGVPVPGDESQTVYVWADALINYISAAGYGVDQDRYRSRWCAADERLHVIGKGISRFHAVYWLGLLLAAGEPLPTRISIHEYLQTGGRKISKSGSPRPSDPAIVSDPDDLLTRYGRDAVRWWLVSDVTPVGDTDFSEERLKSRYTEDLANTVGNLINRTVALAQRGLGGEVRIGPPDAVARPVPPGLQRAADLAAALPERIDVALDDFNHRQATARIIEVAAAANAAIEATRPWQHVRPAVDGDPVAREQLRTILAALLQVCRRVAVELTAFVPDGAARLLGVLGDPVAATETLRLGPAEPAFPRLAPTSDRVPSSGR
ncbi:methionine--tRNA ligase [Microlunatus soli]|uniref:methionine--tRNA ligase n=1 Tax=Microlunatus soli TaxID=630515 RepID=A0A1H2ALX5_9ACTN|nr:methionine--tRNA ligase [Microlunatus soli]SDT46879.1 methionyl-tRNA synthetase [Microlunatus soli]